MHYLDEGEGPPVILLHGNPTWSFMFRELILSLRRHFRVIVPDHLGCGLSDVPERDQYPYLLKSRVDDLEALIDHLQLEGPINLGMHDWGGVIGMSWAVRHADRVGRVILLNTAAFLMPAGKQFFWLLRMARQSSLARFLILRCNAFLYAALWFGCQKRRLPTVVRRAYFAPYNIPYRRIPILEFIRDIPLEKSHPSYDYLAETDHKLHLLRGRPLMLCWGERDLVFDRDFLNEWIRRFPGARVHAFTDSGHFVLEDANLEIVRLTSDFLRPARRP